MENDFMGKIKEFNCKTKLHDWNPTFFLFSSPEDLRNCKHFFFVDLGWYHPSVSGNLLVSNHVWSVCTREDVSEENQRTQGIIKSFILMDCGLDGLMVWWFDGLMDFWLFIIRTENHRT